MTFHQFQLVKSQKWYTIYIVKRKKTELTTYTNGKLGPLWPFWALGGGPRLKKSCVIIFSKPGWSQGLLYKHLRHSVSDLFSKLWFVKIYLRRRHALMVKDGAFSHKIDYVTKSHYWFKSYCNFAELVGFACWWKCIGKGFHLQPPQQACFKAVAV